MSHFPPGFLKGPDLYVLFTLKSFQQNRNSWGQDGKAGRTTLQEERVGKQVQTFEMARLAQGAGRCVGNTHGVVEDDVGDLEQSELEFFLLGCVFQLYAIYHFCNFCHIYVPPPLL